MRVPNVTIVVCRLIFCLFCLLVFTQPVYAQDFEELNNMAYKEKENKNYNKAIELSTQSINKKVNARAYIIRGISRLNLKDFEAAIEDLTAALLNYSSYYTNNTEKAGIYFWRGWCKHSLYHYADAITDYNAAFSNDYNNVSTLYWNRGLCYSNLMKYKEAEDDYIKAIDRISESKDLSSLYYERASCQAELGNYEKAYTLFARAISYNSKNYRAYWLRAYYKNLKYNYEDALVDYTKAIDIATETNSSNINDLNILYRNKALVHQNLKQYDNAIAAITKVIEISSNLANGYRTRADIYKSMKKYEKAKADYGNAIALETDKKVKADIYLTRSMMHWNILDYKSCLDDLNKAVALDPSNGMLYWHRSLAYGYKKNYPVAIKEANSALDLYKSDSSSTTSLIWLRALHKDKAGDYKGAAEDLQNYLKYYPASYGGYYELGRLFKLKLKNNDLANANLSKSAELAENKLDTVKYCYIKVIKGDKEEAIKKMLQVVENNKDSKYWYDDLHNMACIYALAGNTAKALEYVDKSLAAGFDDYLHLVNDRDLISLMKLPQWKTMLAKYKVPTPNSAKIELRVTKGDEDFWETGNAKKKSTSEAKSKKNTNVADPSDRTDKVVIRETKEARQPEDSSQRRDRLYNIFVTKGDAYTAKKEYENAKTAYWNAIALKPDDEEVQNKLTEVEKELAAITNENSVEKSYDSLMVEATVQFKEKQYDASESSYTEALKLKPESSSAKSQITYIRQIKVEIAKALAKKQKEDQEEAFKKAVAKGNSAITNKNYSEAVTAYKEALAIHPEDEWSLARLKIAEYQMGLNK